jgi:hypothetical protein
VRKSTILLCAALAVTACAESRYRSNVQHAPVTRWTHLSRSDYEQVVRLVSHATHQPIIGITTAPPKIRHDPLTRCHRIRGLRNPRLDWISPRKAGGWLAHYVERRDFAFRCRHDFIEPRLRAHSQQRPNQAMERTAARRAFPFSVATTPPLRATLAPDGRRSSFSR